MSADQATPYCHECGSESLAYQYQCASGRIYKCKDCGNDVQCLHPAPAPTTRMQPRDETAARMEFERAKRLLESHGWTVTAPVTVGCESIGQRA
jgi:hypothetical protein